MLALKAAQGLGVRQLVLVADSSAALALAGESIFCQLFQSNRLQRLANRNSNLRLVFNDLHKISKSFLTLILLHQPSHGAVVDHYSALNSLADAMAKE